MDEQPTAVRLARAKRRRRTTKLSGREPVVTRAPHVETGRARECGPEPAKPGSRSGSSVLFGAASPGLPRDLGLDRLAKGKRGPQDHRNVVCCPWGMPDVSRGAERRCARTGS
jgi:hypothetical protein